MSYNQYDDRAIMAEKFEELFKEKAQQFVGLQNNQVARDALVELAMDCFNKASNVTVKAE